MTAQERAEISDLRKDVKDGFTEIRGLHLDMIQRIARLEASAQTTQVSTQFRLMQLGLIVSLVGCGWNIFTTH